jgi:hypothetical protein
MEGWIARKHIGGTDWRDMMSVRIGGPPDKRDRLEGLIAAMEWRDGLDYMDRSN